MPGKCYSQANRGQRRESDTYSTPHSMVWQLIEYYQGFNYANSIVYDPCCGNGNVLKALEDYNIASYGTDIIQGDDFLKKEREDENPDLIITNPPFSWWAEFITKAKEIVNQGFAFLGKIDFLTGIKRYESEIYYSGKFKLSDLLIFVRKPDLRHEIRADGKYSTGIDGYAWYIFKQHIRHPPRIDWIDNQEYILKAEDIRKKD